MERETIASEKPITIGEVKLVPIVRTFVSCRGSRLGIVCWATKETIGIVAVSPEGKRAMNMNGEEVPLSRYAEWMPEV